MPTDTASGKETVSIRYEPTPTPTSPCIVCYNAEPDRSHFAGVQVDGRALHWTCLFDVIEEVVEAKEAREHRV